MKKSDFNYILQLLRRYAGWELSAENYFVIDSKIYNFICERGYLSSDDLIQELKSGQKAMLWQVVEALTMSDTYFNRDYPVFKSFNEFMLPRLREVNRASKKLRIWSLGCASGQETYSIAMSVNEHLTAVGDWNISILGTDISTPSISKAQKGIYSQLEVQMGMNIRQIIKNFHREGKNWVVNPEISANTKFLRYNLLDDLSNVEDFDVIFCRYVLQYFPKDLQRQIIAKIHKHQVPAGFLYLGMNEQINGLSDYYEAVPSMPCLYQAKLDGRHKQKSGKADNKQVAEDEMPSLMRPHKKSSVPDFDELNETLTDKF